MHKLHPLLKFTRPSRPASSTGMGATPRLILNWIWLTLVATTLGGCATRPRTTVPTAIVYDRHRDAWRVEVAETDDAPPEYPETVPIFTVQNGERRKGLIPPAKYRVPDPNGVVRRWNGPTALKQKNGFWRDQNWYVQRMLLRLPRSSTPNETVDVSVYFVENANAYGIYVAGQEIAR